MFANFNRPDLGMAIVDRLEAAGYTVIVPDQQSSGYPFIAYGDLRRARKTAAFNVTSLAPYAKQGYTIVSPEPTAASALKKSYPKLLGNSPESIAVASQTRELFEFLNEIEGETRAPKLTGRRFGFHCSCHQRPLGGGTAAMEWLRRQGAQVELIETGTCCGMGGTFGLKAGALGYDLSNAVGENLFTAFRDAGVDTIVTESSVCNIQLSEGTGLRVCHPLDLLLA